MVIFGLYFSWNWLAPLDFNGSTYSFNKIEIIMKIDCYLPEICKFIKWETLPQLCKEPASILDSPNFQNEIALLSWRGLFWIKE